MRMAKCSLAISQCMAMVGFLGYENRFFLMSTIERIFLLCAPKRSGHHAFIDWMLSSHNLNALHINNTDESNGWLMTKYLARRPDYRIRSKHGALPIQARAEKQDVIAAMKQQEINTLVFNFEDKLSCEIKCSPILESLILDFRDATIASISFSRDPLNLLASRIVRSVLIEKDQTGCRVASALASRPHGMKVLSSLIQTIKPGLREYCNQKMKSDIYIDYYSWLSSQPARLEIEQALGMESIQPSRDATIHGGGSSFGKMTAIEPSDQFKRYEQLGDIEVFQSAAFRMKRIALRYYDKIAEYVDSSPCRDYLHGL